MKPCCSAQVRAVGIAACTATLLLSVLSVANANLYCFGQLYVGEGIDGIQSHIEVPEFVIVDTRISVWCGFDYNSQHWLQTGWRQEHLEAPKAYYEYTTDQGAYNIQQPADAVTGSYRIERIGQFVFVTIYGLLYATLSWSDFDHRDMCHLQSGAELHGPTDRVPGQAGEPVVISDIQYRKLYSEQWESPAFDPISLNNSYCGCRNLSTGSISLWDRRSFFEETCPPQSTCY